MILLDDLKEYIGNFVSHVLFEYNGKSCGVDPIYGKGFDIWYGEKSETMSSIDQVFHSPFFDGKSLTEIFKEIEPDY